MHCGGVCERERHQIFVQISHDTDRDMCVPEEKICLAGCQQLLTLHKSDWSVIISNYKSVTQVSQWHFVPIR